MGIRTFTVHQALQWIGCGWRFWKQDLLLWWVVALVYVAMLFGFALVPIIGTLFIFFITPIMAASALLAMRQARSPKPNDKPPKSVGMKLVAAMFGILAEDEKIIPMLGLGVLILAIGVVIQIIGQLIGGSSLLSPAGILEVGLVAATRIIGSHLAVYLLTALMFMALLYALPLYVLEGEAPDVALKAGLRACLQNIGPVSVYLGSLLVPLFIAAVVLNVSMIAGLIVFLIAGTITIPLLINSAYCSYKLMYY